MAEQPCNIAKCSDQKAQRVKAAAFLRFAPSVKLGSTFDKLRLAQSNEYLWLQDTVTLMTLHLQCILTRFVKKDNFVFGPCVWPHSGFPHKES